MGPAEGCWGREATNINPAERRREANNINPAEKERESADSNAGGFLNLQDFFQNGIEVFCHSQIAEIAGMNAVDTGFAI